MLEGHRALISPPTSWSSESCSVKQSITKWLEQTKWMKKRKGSKNSRWLLLSGTWQTSLERGAPGWSWMWHFWNAGLGRYPLQKVWCHVCSHIRTPAVYKYHRLFWTFETGALSPNKLINDDPQDVSIAVIWLKSLSARERDLFVRFAQCMIVLDLYFYQVGARWSLFVREIVKLYNLCSSTGSSWFHLSPFSFLWSISKKLMLASSCTADSTFCKEGTCCSSLKTRMGCKRMEYLHGWVT